MLAAPAAHQDVPGAAAQHASECQLRIIGGGAGSRSVKEATVHCTGSPVTAGVNAILHSASIRGITRERSCMRSLCPLTICGNSSVLLRDVLVAGMPMIGLCIIGNASVTITGSSTFRNNTMYDTWGAGLWIGGDASVTVTGGTTIEGNTAINQTATTFGGGIAVSDNASAWITGNTLIQSNSANGGGGICARDGAKLHVLGRTRILANKAGTGGAIAAMGWAQVHVSGASVLADNNVTTGGGGVLAAHFSNVSLFGNSMLIGNSAISGGAVMAMSNSSTTISGNCTIWKNKARIGAGVLAETNITITGNARVIANRNSGVAVIGKGVVTISGNASVADNEILEFAGAGVLVNDTAKVLLDGFASVRGNKAIGGVAGGLFAGDAAVIEIGPNARVEGNLANNRREGRLTADDVTVYAQAKLVIAPAARISKCSLGVRLLRLPCEGGEFLQNGACVCCPNGTFSLGSQDMSSTCYPCPPNADCEAEMISPRPGFWHSSPHSSQIHACPGHTAACGHGGVCMPGYFGTLCGSCATPAYGATGGFKCRQCRRPVEHLALYLMIAMLAILFVAFTAHLTWKDNLNDPSSITVAPTDVIKPLVQFAQYLVILGTISAPWPEVLQLLFRASSVVFGAASGEAFSLDCWLAAYFGRSRVPLAMQRQLLYFLAPVAVLIAVLLLQGLWWSVRRLLVRRGQVRPTVDLLLRKVPVTILVLVFYAYPTLVKASLSFFACHRIDVAGQGPYPEYATATHAQGYWLADLQQACYVGGHRKWAVSLGLVSMILFCVLGPVGLWLGLLANRSRADEPSFREHFGFVYRKYEQSRLWWEAVRMVQTVLLTLVSVFHFTIGPFFSILLLQLIFLSFGMLQVLFKPYTQRTLHLLHLVATACLFMTATCALSFFRVNQQDTSALSKAQSAVAVLAGLADVLFVLWCLYTIVVKASPLLGAMHKVTKALMPGIMHKRNRDKGPADLSRQPSPAP